MINGIATDGVDALALRGDAGFGKTTILERVQRAAGGVLLGMEQFADVLAERQPGAIEEALRDLIEYALASHDLAIVDDLHLIAEVAESCSCPRANLLNAVLTAILAGARARTKKLLCAVNDDVPWPLRRRAYSWTIGNFSPADYETICCGHLGSEAASRLDYSKIHRFAPILSGHQLRNANVWLVAGTRRAEPACRMGETMAARRARKALIEAPL